MKKAIFLGLACALLLGSAVVHAKVAPANEVAGTAKVEIEATLVRLAHDDFNGSMTLNSMDQAKTVCPKVCATKDLHWSQELGWYNDEESSAGKAGSICRCAKIE